MMKKLKPYLEVLPVVSIILFVLVFGILGALVQSLGYFPAMGMRDITLKYYMDVIRSRTFTESLRFSLYTTTVSSFAATVLGVVLAKLLVGLKGKYEFFYRIPIIVPHITVALFSITFLSESGIMARLFYMLGMKNAQYVFSKILFSSNGLGIILAYIWKESPFIVVSCMAILKRLSGKYENAAVNLGAGRVYAFMKVTLPMLLPTIVSTFTIIFAFSFGAYELPMLLGATVPKALPVQAFIEYQNPMIENRPYAMAVNVIIALLCVVFVSVFNIVIKRIWGGEKPA